MMKTTSPKVLNSFPPYFSSRHISLFPAAKPPTTFCFRTICIYIYVYICICIIYIYYIYIPVFPAIVGSQTFKSLSLYIYIRFVVLSQKFSVCPFSYIYIYYVIYIYMYFILYIIYIYIYIYVQILSASYLAISCKTIIPFKNSALLIIMCVITRLN